MYGVCKCNRRLGEFHVAYEGFRVLWRAHVMNKSRILRGFKNSLRHTFEVCVHRHYSQC